VKLLAYLRERLPDRNLWVVYRTMLVLSTAYGIALANLPNVLAERHIDPSVVGQLASWFALGLVLFAAPSGAIIRRFSARVVLPVSIVGYGAMIAIIPLLSSYTALAVDRFVDGLFSMGAWMSGETLLLWRSNRQNKALAMSLSATFTMFGYVVGPAFSYAVSGFVAQELRFYIAGAIAVVAAIVCAIGLDPDPKPEARNEEPSEKPPETDDSKGFAGTLALAYRMKTSCAATFASGFFQASGALFIPRFLVEEKGIPEEQASLVVAFAAAGMLLVSNFAARAGDKYGHLAVMRALAMSGVVAMFAFLPLDWFPLMGLAIMVAGGCFSSMPPLSLALQGAIVSPAEYTRSNSIFNVFFASGLLVGPLITGNVFSSFGGSAIVFLFAGIWLIFVIVSVLFRKDDPRARAGTTRKETTKPAH
jgi:predicted MFS family arabinose efflux permease